jgi:hypothetical protein
MDHRRTSSGTDERAAGPMRRASSTEARGYPARDQRASIAAISGEGDESPSAPVSPANRIRSLRLCQWISSKDLRGAGVQRVGGATPRTAVCGPHAKKDLVVQDPHLRSSAPLEPRESLTSMGEQPECGAQRRQSATGQSRG